MKRWLSFLIKQLSDLFFPRLCAACERQLVDTESYVCGTCILGLPRYYPHLPIDDNEMTKLFRKQVQVERAMAFLHYIRKTESAGLVKTLKYKKNPMLGIYVGRWMALEMMPLGIFDSIDLLLPVPLHPKRLKKRGYNQCERLAEGISQITSIPVDTESLIRWKYNPSQTKLRGKKTNRRENVKGIFALASPERLHDKHILLIDDVVTSGSTLISCMKPLSQVPGIRISVLALSFARS